MESHSSRLIATRSLENGQDSARSTGRARPGRSSSARPVSSGTGARRDPPTMSSRSTSSLSDKILPYHRKYFVATLLRNLFFLIAGFVKHDYVIRFLQTSILIL